MGNTFFCNRCDSTKLQVSKACAEQFLIDDGNDDEVRSMCKLRQLDEAHSKLKGLTVEAFNEQFDELEKRIHARTVTVYCKNKDQIIECLAQNPHCMANCHREMNDFIECVDAVRIRRIRDRARESARQEIIASPNS